MLFKHLDVDGNGSLTWPEFQYGVSALNQQLDERDRIEEEGLEDLFHRLDEDGSGTIQLEEWRKMW